MASPPPKTPCVSPPNWLELPDDVSASILRRLDAVEILTSAQHVCTTWRRICRDPSMWTSINIRIHKLRNNTRDNLTKLYRQAVDLSSGGLLDIRMEYSGYDHLLRYIAYRTNHLRRLRLVYCDSIPALELVEAAGKLSSLEELELSHCNFPSDVVAAIGRLCPLLQSFKLNHQGCKLLSFTGGDDEAFAIAENMPGLRHLQIFGNKLRNDGLNAILDGCQHLESLDLRQCFHVNLDADMKRRCTERIKHFRGPNDSTDDYPFDSQVYDESSHPQDFLVDFVVPDFAVPDFDFVFDFDVPDFVVPDFDFDLLAEFD